MPEKEELEDNESIFKTTHQDMNEEDAQVLNEAMDDEDQASSEAASETESVINALSPDNTFEIIQKFEDPPHAIFNDPNYYKHILVNSGEIGVRFHKTLKLLLQATTPEDRSAYRQRIIPLYWDLLEEVVGSYLENPNDTIKILLYRFNVILPNLLNEEQKASLSKVVMKNQTSEPIHYVDEWLVQVADGNISPLATDEAKPISQYSPDEKIQMKLEKAKGSLDAAVLFTQNQVAQRKELEKEIETKLNRVKEHDSKDKVVDIEGPYSADQRQQLVDINQVSRKLMILDKEMTNGYRLLDEANTRYKDALSLAKESGVVQTLGNEEMRTEVSSLRQIMKLCVGRQGNHFPFLMSQYLQSSFVLEMATREKIIGVMRKVELLDAGLFLRTFKQQTSRIVPHVIIAPCYGNYGICWEPFERSNRATSRGRIAIPLFPNNLKAAVVFALADLRWQVAKEKAQHYWMEEGLTGHYYQWFTDQKLKGDVRLKFIADYYLWIMKESEGMQKLDRKARGVFWRDIPFPKELRETLKNRGFVYNELNKKDINRAMSDGY